MTPPHMLCPTEGDEQQNKFVASFRYASQIYACMCVHVGMSVCVCVSVCICVCECMCACEYLYVCSDL